jgi:hypothetical protein
MKQQSVTMAVLLATLLMGGTVMAEPLSPYDPEKDPFYLKRPITVTWVMIWNGSSEKWWKTTDYQGCKVLIDGAWQSINWSSEAHIDAYCQAIRDAGINVIAVDFTNGFRWEWQAKRIQKFCHDNKMKFTVAFNPQGGGQMESGCRKVWEVYASPAAPFPETYLHKDGKPLVVLYSTSKGYAASVAVKDTYRDKFSTAWASGEESDRNKWGWQLEPHIGPVPSGDAMFVTGSVKFGSPRTTDFEWRKHLAWLDYGFIKAREISPKFLIVGSFDDVHERNAWMVTDTAEAPKGWHMRGKGGALSHDAYYNRVCDWLKGSPSTVAGGLVQDGAYIVKSADGLMLGSESNRFSESRATLKSSGDDIDHLIWFYHLGGNTYRLIKLNAGLAFEAKGAKVHINWDSDSDTQRWQLSKAVGGYRLINQASKEALAFSGKTVLAQPSDAASPAQFWTLVPRALIER